MSDEELPPITAIHKKKKNKHKSLDASSDAQNIPSSFKPPHGFKLSTERLETSEFDWDTIANNPDLELWAIRVPTGLRIKHLNNMSFPLQSTSTTGSSLARITAGKKQKQYDVRSGEDGAEEMQAFSVLLPRASKGGKLFCAPKELSGTLLISEVMPEIATSSNPTPTQTTLPPLPLPSSKRYSHPPHLLKHRFAMTSSISPLQSHNTSEDVVMEAQSASDIDSPPPSKKRKKDAEPEPSSPLKTKKHKKEHKKA